MVPKLIGGALAAVLMLAGFAPTAAATSDTPLLLSQGPAFAILGHSCGGIQEQAFATGFDSNGEPTGAIYLQTRCGGSGRGGGYHTTTYSAWANVTWDFTGAALSSTVVAAPAGLDPAFSASDGYGDTAYNVLNAVNVLPANCVVGNITYCAYRAYLSVALPVEPTGVGAVRSGGQYLVSWSTESVTPATLSFTVTATPVAPSTAPVVTLSVAGNATSALIGPLQPLTSYLIDVTSTNPSGTSQASSPAVPITTPASAQVPAAPASVKVSWGGAALMASWTAAAPGDSPVDAYRVKVTAHDADPPVPGPYATNVGGTILSTSFTLKRSLDWSVRVRAHNAAGWGPWSKAVVLGGL